MSASSHPLKTDIFTTTKNGLHPSISYCYRTRKSRFWYVSDKSIVIYRCLAKFVVPDTNTAYCVTCSVTTSANTILALLSMSPLFKIRLNLWHIAKNTATRDTITVVSFAAWISYNLDGIIKGLVDRLLKV